MIETVDTIEITEVATDANCTVVPEEIEAVAPRENEEQSENCSTSTTTPPGSPQRENPEIQNSSKDTTQVETETEQAVQKTHQSPEVNNSLVNKVAFNVIKWDFTHQDLIQYQAGISPTAPSLHQAMHCIITS